MKKNLLNDPEIFWENCKEYFNGIDNDPVITDFVRCGVECKRHTPRPYTFKGLFEYLGITKEQFEELLISEEMEDVSSRIKSIIEDNQLTLAMVFLCDEDVIGT
jgi:DNA-packaging protein gp3